MRHTEITNWIADIIDSNLSTYGIIDKPLNQMLDDEQVDAMDNLNVDELPDFFKNISGNLAAEIAAKAEDLIPALLEIALANIVHNLMTIRDQHGIPESMIDEIGYTTLEVDASRHEDGTCQLRAKTYHSRHELSWGKVYNTVKAAALDLALRYKTELELEEKTSEDTLAYFQAPVYKRISQGE